MNNSPINDDQISAELGRIPRVEARQGFTREVLSRTQTAVSVFRWPMRRVLPAAVTAALVLLLGLWTQRSGLFRDGADDLKAHSDAGLRKELSEVQAELERLRRQAPTTEPDPVIYLGGTNDLDIVFDMRNYLAAQPLGARPAGPHQPVIRNAVDVEPRR